jgi:hypothetical protein
MVSAIHLRRRDLTLKVKKGHAMLYAFNMWMKSWLRSEALGEVMQPTNASSSTRTPLSGPTCQRIDRY